jgi:hypothetical protein
MGTTITTRPATITTRPATVTTPTTMPATITTSPTTITTSPIGAELFTTLDMAYINKDVINIIHKEKPTLVSNEANEFLDYTVYN